SNSVHFACAEEIHDFRRNLALLPTVPKQQCNREPLGGCIYGEQQLGCWCGVQSRIDENVDRLGNIFRFHLPSVVSDLERAVIMRGVFSPSFTRASQKPTKTVIVIGAGMPGSPVPTSWSGVGTTPLF